MAKSRARPKTRRPAAQTRMPPEPLPQATDAAIQINKLVDVMDTYTKHSVECFLCCARESEMDITEQQFARSLYEAGWREIDSAMYQTIGIACPECVRTPDAERGL